MRDCSGNQELLSDPRKLLVLSGIRLAPEPGHPQEFMMKMFAPDFSEASVKWCKSSGFAEPELLGMCVLQ